MSRFIKAKYKTVCAVDTETGLEWSKTLLKGKNCTQAEAEEACKALGKGWRLPTIKELFSIVDHTKYAPAVDKAVFKDTKSDYYWSSTPVAASPDCAWVVSFSNGNVYFYGGDLSACVRAVRPSQS